jgi:hypothetical protein
MKIFLILRLIACAYLLDSLIFIFTHLDDFLLFLNTILDKYRLLLIMILWLLLLVLVLIVFIFMLLILLVHDLIFYLRTLQPIGYDLLILRFLLFVLVNLRRFLLIVFVDHLNQLLAGFFGRGWDDHRGLGLSIIDQDGVLNEN